MTSLFARHAVSDYGKWLESYKAMEPLRSQHGCIGDRVWRCSETPNCIMYMNEFRTLEEARAFIASPLLQVAMARAGVDDPQQVEYFIEAE